MREVTIEEAIKKGQITLVWIPMVLFFFFLLGSIGLGLLLPNRMLILMIGGFLLAFTIPWLWWSMKVVNWKIWAYSHVKDGRTLERRAISQQLIWPRGSFFEKTEIKSYRDQQTLEELYRKMDSSTSSKEIITDDSLPEELTIDYPKANLYLYLVLSVASLYLVYLEVYFFGILCLVVFAYTAYDLNKKIRNKEFVLKINDRGVTLPTGNYLWPQIKSYHVEKQGYGRSITYSLIIEGRGIHKSILLSEANVNAFQIERYLDVYRSRYEMKNKATR